MTPLTQSEELIALAIFLMWMLVIPVFAGWILSRTRWWKDNTGRGDGPEA